MRLRFAWFALPAFVAAVMVVLVSPASAITKPQTFSLLSIDSGTEQPIGDFAFNREPRPGDRFSVVDYLYKWAGTKRGARVGRLEALCTFTHVQATEQTLRSSAHCGGTFFLPAGQVGVAGFLPITDGPLNFALPVVGGTGAYANARGWVHIKDLGNGNAGHSNNEFHLLP
jgi:hypothetical protein